MTFVRRWPLLNIAAALFPIPQSVMAMSHLLTSRPPAYGSGHVPTVTRGRRNVGTQRGVKSRKGMTAAQQKRASFKRRNRLRHKAHLNRKRRG